MVQPLTIWSVLKNLKTERCFIAQQSHRRVEFPPGIERKDRNRYFCPRVHSRLTHNSHKVAAAQCPVLAGWMDKKRGHRCICNQRNAGACSLRSECPPTRLANIGSFEKGWEDGEDSHPVTRRSKSEVLGEETVPVSFPKALVRPAFHLPGSVLWERSRVCTPHMCAFHHRFAPNGEARSSQKACPSKGTSEGSWTWHNSSLGWHRTILTLNEPTAPHAPLHSHRGGLCTWPLDLVSCLPLVLPELVKPEVVLMITKLAVFFWGEAGGGLGSWCRMWAVRLCPPSLLKGTVLQSPPYTGNMK